MTVRPTALPVVMTLLVALAALLCVGNLAGPIIALTGDLECSEVFCEEQIACGRQAAPAVTAPTSPVVILAPAMVGIPTPARRRTAAGPQVQLVDTGRAVSPSPSRAPPA